LEEHATWLLALIEKRPDLTLEEVVAAMGKQGIEGSRTAVWRFFKRHDVSFKKNTIRQRTKPSRCGPRAPTLDPPAAPPGLHRVGVSCTLSPSQDRSRVFHNFSQQLRLSGVMG